MGSRRISLTDEAYEALAQSKRKDESFSGFILRTFGRRRPSLLDFTKIMSPEAGEQVERAVRRHRREQARLQRERLKRWER